MFARHRTDRTDSARYIPWIEHLRGCRAARIEQIQPPDAAGSRPFAVTGGADLTPVRLAPGPGSNTCRTSGSNTCAAPDPRIEHLQHAPNAADRTLARQRVSRRHLSGSRGPADRTVVRTPGSNTCATAESTDRTLTACSMPWIEHLRGCRAARIEQIQPPDTAGSRPFSVAGGADRHPSGWLHVPDRTLAERADRTLARSRAMRIEHLQPAPRHADRTPAQRRTHGSNIPRTLRTPRIEHLRESEAHGSNTYGLLHAADRTLARSPGARIETPSAGSRPRIDTLPTRSIPWIETLSGHLGRGSTRFPPAPCRGSTPFAVVGGADRHPSDPLRSVGSPGHRVFLFDGPRLHDDLVKHGVKIGEPKSIRKKLWDGAEIHPRRNADYPLSAEQRKALELFRAP